MLSGQVEEQEAFRAIETAISVAVEKNRVSRPPTILGTAQSFHLTAYDAASVALARSLGVSLIPEDWHASRGALTLLGGFLREFIATASAKNDGEGPAKNHWPMGKGFPRPGEKTSFHERGAGNFCFRAIRLRLSFSALVQLLEAKSAVKTNEIVGVVGLGYVGMPLAVSFSKHTRVVAYDIRPVRVEELRSGRDHTGETDPKDLKHPNLYFTSEPQDLAQCTTIIVAVPTPVNIAKEPDLDPLIRSSEMIGKILKKGMMIVYESTVYPGVTEEICLPILEKESGLKLGQFDLAYSPERINPGDKEHSLANVVKIVSGHNAKALKRCMALYRLVVNAGLHPASNIKTAEAAKVIENVQRDLNIALMNELSKIFARMGLDTYEVIEAAATKWNFHKYYPGLVGGHCIGVDPYYLTHRALMLGYHPEVILAGRRINDSMGSYVGELCIREMIAAGRLPKGANVWILGMTFKENVPDFRNTRAEDVVHYLRGFGCNVTTWEPLGQPEFLRRKFNIETVRPEEARDIDAIILINKHDVFKKLKLPALRRACRTPVLVDVKHFFPRRQAEKLGFRYVCL